MSIETSYPLTLNIRSIKHLSYYLKIPPKEIDFFARNKERHVSPLELLQVRNGKTKKRLVYNPSSRYKLILRAINKSILSRSSFPKGVLGGIIGKSIDDMCVIHCGQEAVFSIDLKNFFPSIASGRVFKLFVKAGCTNNIASLLTDLVTLNGSVPQGFPTSPMLANLTAFELDIQHLSYCQKNGIMRTRWIDDIVFLSTPI